MPTDVVEGAERPGLVPHHEDRASADPPELHVSGFGEFGGATHGHPALGENLFLLQLVKLRSRVGIRNQGGRVINGVAEGVVGFGAEKRLGGETLGHGSARLQGDRIEPQQRVPCDSGTGSQSAVLRLEAQAEFAPRFQFIAEAGHALSGKHHELYLSDPRRTAPEKLKTILRQPVG